jgi:hypothetical protein
MCRLPLPSEAVAQTLGGPVRPFLKVGSENGHLVRHAHVVRRELIAQGCSGVPFRERGLGFPRALYATASSESSSSRNGRRLLGVPHSPALHIRLPRAQLDAIDQRAVAAGMSRSAVARHLIAVALGADDAPPPVDWQQSAAWLEREFGERWALPDPYGQP